MESLFRKVAGKGLKLYQKQLHRRGFCGFCEFLKNIFFIDLFSGRIPRSWKFSKSNHYIQINYEV